MSVVKHFISETIKRVKIEEFLQKKFKRAGFGGVDITKTPMGTHLVVYAMRPGIIIGRGGQTIKELTRTLEENLQVPNPQISVAEIEVPELNAQVMASRIASNLERGIHYRRAGFWALNRIMEADALGAEIVISGKLRTDRHRYEKFRGGYMPKSGNPMMTHMRESVMHVQLKVGIIGVVVQIMPKIVFPDHVSIVEEVVEEAQKETEEEADKSIADL